MIRLSGSVKFFWALASGVGEGGAGSRPPVPRPSPSCFSSAAACSLSLASAAALASASSSALACRIFAARRCLSATQSGISSPLLSRSRGSLRAMEVSAPAGDPIQLLFEEIDALSRKTDRYKQYIQKVPPEIIDRNLKRPRP